MHDLLTILDHTTDIESLSDDQLAALLVRLEPAAAAVRALPNPSVDDQDLGVLAARVRIEHRRRMARAAIVATGVAA